MSVSLALRHDVPDHFRWHQRLYSHLIKWRLHTRYPHSAVVVGKSPQHALLLHSNGPHGVHRLLPGHWQPDRWLLIPVDDDDADDDVLRRYHQVAGARYDYLGALGFALGARLNDRTRWYCYELSYYLLTGNQPTGRITPEDLLCFSRYKLASGF